MPRRLRCLALFAALVAGLLTACSSGPLPDGSRLLSESSAAMRSVTSTKMRIDVDGTLPGLPIKSANGVLTKQGSAQGTVSLDMGQQPFDLSFVIIGKDAYLRGPTGGFRKLSSLPYDPTKILDPQQGVAAVLASGTNPQTQDEEQVDGVDTYLVDATFPAARLRQLVPGYDQTQPSKVWIGARDHRVVQAEFPVPDGKLTLHMSDYDAPVDITPPI